MIKQVFDVESYFKVIVYYNVDYDFFNMVEKDLNEAGISKLMLRELWLMMYYEKAKAVTYSNIEEHICVVLFNYHEDEKDYINSIVHEAEHVKQAMLEAYQIEDKGEPPAYTMGYLVGRMWEVFKELVCMECKHKGRDNG